MIWSVRCFRLWLHAPSYGRFVVLACSQASVPRIVILKTGVIGPKGSLFACLKMIAEIPVGLATQFEVNEILCTLPRNFVQVLVRVVKTRPRRFPPQAIVSCASVPLEALRLSLNRPNRSIGRSVWPVLNSGAASYRHSAVILKVSYRLEESLLVCSKMIAENSRGACYTIRG